MTSGKMLSILLILLGILLIIYWVPTNQSMLATGEIRAALDIGSGATNLKIAKVDPATDKITAVLLEKSLPVPYQKELELSTNNTFNQSVMDQGIQAIKTLKEIANQYQVKKIVAVATAAFRQADNAPQFAQEIEAQTGVPIRIINQDEEGVLAFRGALALTPVDPQQTVVWDIGGGSMQLTTLTDVGTYLVEKGKTASAPFKNFVIQHVQKHRLETVSTPNPITLDQMALIINQAKEFAGQTDPFIQNKLIQPTTKVLAVGNLFNYSVRPLVNSQIVERQALHQAVDRLANKTDAELPGQSFADVSVTNPLMILGYMERLHIPQVEVVNVNNADGALTYPAYWQ
jgi:exopolyphosphatase / guanosine-5'-triphosphate,3'-diphosphate pyrophosphatase